MDFRAVPTVDSIHGLPGELRHVLHLEAYSLRRMAIISNPAIRRVADQMLADATTAKSKIKPAEVAGPVSATIEQPLQPISE
jgi:hypothetical protein